MYHILFSVTMDVGFDFDLLLLLWYYIIDKLVPWLRVSISFIVKNNFRQGSRVMTVSQNLIHKLLENFILLKVFTTDYQSWEMRYFQMSFHLLERIQVWIASFVGKKKSLCIVKYTVRQSTNSAHFFCSLIMCCCLHLWLHPYNIFLRWNLMK